ncbi:MAG: hypothetical protein U9R21_08070, partial [Candidatus Thermoplasmatota archaeon]|nr:hypothetical protein [Candidatus Thermoplasmatota archaeon]
TTCVGYTIISSGISISSSPATESRSALPLFVLDLGYERGFSRGGDSQVAGGCDAGQARAVAASPGV